jgi:iron complex outermembrane recepter protein
VVHIAESMRSFFPECRGCRFFVAAASRLFLKRGICGIALFCVLLSLGLGPSLRAQEERPVQTEPEIELADLDLKALMNLEITSVSRRPERLSGAAASVFVITADEIRRSGATNIPEALRLAPALDVVQGNANGYSVTARGCSNSANKLLVLIDGRSVYSPLFSGVFWDVQDVLLEDIDRIEVISGPGGTLWGVNAVNGVVNIITRPAKNTPGALLAAEGGDRGHMGALRYGGRAGGDGDYRAFAKYSSFGHTETVNGTDKNDSGHKLLAGFRGDWERGADQLSVVGNAYRGLQGQPLPGTIAITGVNLPLGAISLSGVNLTGRWVRRFGNGSGNDSTMTVQGYFDRTVREVPPTFSERLNIVDLQILHTLRLARRHDVAWGAEYRYGMDRVTNSIYVAFLPAHVNQTWGAVFAQDEVTLSKNLRLTLGARNERNDYTGNEFLPNARLVWNVAPDHALWAAASRTVRAPSRLDHDTVVPGQPPFILTGGPDVVSEVAKVYELGYRAQPASAVTFSMTAFRSFYDHLRTQEIAPSRTSIFFSNQMHGTISGVEMWGSYQATRRWRLSGGFNGLREHFDLDPGSNDLGSLAAQRGRDPERSWRLRSSLDLPHRGELDLTARHVSERASPSVPAYSAVDIRYGWKPYPGTELSVTGVNLFDKGHGEFSDVVTRTEIGRGVFVKIVQRFGRGS